MDKIFCSVCGKDYLKESVVPEYEVKYQGGFPELVKSEDWVCKDCLENDRALLYKDGAITQVKGVSIKRLYEVYTRAIERAEERWYEDCLVDGNENDFKPLEVLLCVSEGKAWSYYDLPWSSTNGWSEKMYFATRINLLDGKFYVSRIPEFEDAEEEEDVYETWLEELRDNCSLYFKSFEEVVEDLIGNYTFNH